MTQITQLLLASLFTCGLLWLPLSAQSLITYHLGATEDAVVDTEYSLLLMGGGSEPDDGMRWWLEHAKGGDVVILRANDSDGYQHYFYKELGVSLNSVRTFVFSNRKQASDPEVIQHLRQAEAIWFSGGDQAKYSRFWGGTPVVDAINDHIIAGKPVGGTSAGLAILGEFSYTALKDSATSQAVLKDPFHEDITIERNLLRIPMLRNVITDTHFMERRRLGRLITFLARIQNDYPGIQPIGIGVDESTALGISGNGEMQVFQKQKGLVHFVLPGKADTLTANEPLQMRGIKVISIGSESTVQLNPLSFAKPAAVTVLSVADGKLHAEDAPQP